MRLVDQHHRAVFLGDPDHLLERGDITQHRVDALEDHQLARAFRDALEAFFHRLDVIVLERHHLGIAELAAVPDAGVAIDI